jgi:hypothetical protein
MTDGFDAITSRDRTVASCANDVPSVAVGFLLRGADKNWRPSAHRFLASYKAHPAGFAHVPHVMLQGFADRIALSETEREFRKEGFVARHLDEDGFDIVAYARWALDLDSEYICVFNSHSEILADNWLAQFMRNIIKNDIAMVSATASFESLSHSWSAWSAFPRFPNPHLRLNAFCLTRELFTKCVADLKIKRKRGAFLFESSVTKRIINAGKRVAVIGRDGRAYSPRWWPFSGTFRQGTQSNLLVADNVTRTYDQAELREKIRLAAMTWGNYLNEDYPCPHDCSQAAQAR